MENSSANPKVVMTILTVIHNLVDEEETSMDVDEEFEEDYHAPPTGGHDQEKVEKEKAEKEKEKAEKEKVQKEKIKENVLQAE